MDTAINTLMRHEIEELLEALRRDIRSESAKASVNQELSEWHEYNARRSVRLLEALNPKRYAGQSSCTSCLDSVATIDSSSKVTARKMGRDETIPASANETALRLFCN